MPECVNYYGDLKFDTDELVRAGVDPEVVGVKPAKTNSGKRMVVRVFTLAKKHGRVKDVYKREF